MNNSGSYFHTQVVAKRATGYDYDLNGYTSSDFRDQSNTMGTGDIYSTVEDLFKLHLALSDNTLLNHDQQPLIKEQYQSLFFTHRHTYRHTNLAVGVRRGRTVCSKSHCGPGHPQRVFSSPKLSPACAGCTQALAYTRKKAVTGEFYLSTWPAAASGCHKGNDCWAMCGAHVQHGVLAKDRLLS